MSAERSELVREYAGALRAYMDAPDEQARHRAYDLGRHAIADRLGALDIVCLHQQALAQCLTADRPGAELAAAINASSEFLLEGLAAFEMTHRGFLETIARLSQDAARLAQANQRLEAEIRDRMEAEAALRRREAQLGEAQEVAHVGSWEWDMTTDTVVWTDELFRLFLPGETTCPLTYERYMACVHPDDRDMVDDIVRKSVETSEPFRFDHRLVPREGQTRWIHSVGRVVLDPDGRPVRLVGTAQDISERKSFEEALARSEQLFRSLIENSSDVIMIVDIDGTVRYASPSLRRVLGIAEDQMVHRNMFDFLHPEDAPEVVDEFRSCAGIAGCTTSRVFRFRGRHGEWRTLESVCRNLLTEPGISGMLMTSRDITETIRLEHRLREAAQQRASEAKEFAARVQAVQEEERRRIARELHDDICQRLTALRLNVNMLEDDDHHARRPAHRKGLQNVKHQLDRVITDTRRMSANLRPMALDLFGLDAALRTLCEEVQRAHRVRVEFSVHGTAAVEIESGAEIALYRIAQEALHNAARHAGATVISLSLFRGDANVALAVQDDGRGFSPLERNQRKPRLHGYGLRSMRERAELLGGAFDVSSAAHQGTTVTVSLPIHEPERHGENPDRLR